MHSLVCRCAWFMHRQKLALVYILCCSVYVRVRITPLGAPGHSGEQPGKLLALSSSTLQPHVYVKETSVIGYPMWHGPLRLLLQSPWQVGERWVIHMYKQDQLRRRWKRRDILTPRFSTAAAVASLSGEDPSAKHQQWVARNRVFEQPSQHTMPAPRVLGPREPTRGWHHLLPQRRRQGGSIPTKTPSSTPLPG